LSDVAAAVGSFKSNARLLIDLGISLPRGFPAFSLDGGGGFINVRVGRPLSPQEEETLNRTYHSLVSETYPLRIIVDETFSVEKDPFRVPGVPGDIDLIPSTRLVSDTPRTLRSLWEEDEDLWREKRRDVFEARVDSAAQILPQHWDTGRSRCLVHASVFEPHNLRNYLSIYDEVVLVLPIADSTEKILAALHANAKELAELAAMGRLRFALPQSVDRYDMRTLAPIVEAEPDSLILSRSQPWDPAVINCRAADGIGAELGDGRRIPSLSRCARDGHFGDGRHRRDGTEGGDGPRSHYRVLERGWHRRVGYGGTSPLPSTASSSQMRWTSSAARCALSFLATVQPTMRRLQTSITRYR
jgi:hypothetical protein